MFNATKILGVILGLAGVFLTRTTFGFEAQSSQAFFVKTTGVMLACVGIAVFASGIERRIEKKFRICPHCYTKTETEKEACRRCKKPLKAPSQE